MRASCRYCEDARIGPYRGDALEYAHDGSGDGSLADSRDANLASLWSAAASAGEFEALERSAVRRQGSPVDGDLNTCRTQVRRAHSVSKATRNSPARSDCRASKPDGVGRCCVTPTLDHLRPERDSTQDFLRQSKDRSGIICAFGAMALPSEPRATDCPYSIRLSKRCVEFLRTGTR